MTFKWKGAPTDGVAESNGRSYLLRFRLHGSLDRADLDRTCSCRYNGFCFFLLPLLPTLEILFPPKEESKTDATRVRVPDTKETAAANADGIVMSAL
jgi:hypothetical protein